MLERGRTEQAARQFTTVPEELAAGVIEFYRRDLTELIGSDYPTQLETRIIAAIRVGMIYAARVAGGAADVAAVTAQDMTLLPSARAEALGAVKAGRQIADSIRTIAGAAVARDAQAVSPCSSCKFSQPINVHHLNQAAPCGGDGGLR